MQYWYFQENSHVVPSETALNRGCSGGTLARRRERSTLGRLVCAMLSELGANLDASPVPSAHVGMTDKH